MSQQTINCECGCDGEVVILPIRGLAVDKSALGTGGGSVDPSIPSIDYSLEEQWTGKHWIDGKKIYQKTVDLGVLPNKNTKYFPHGIVNRDKIITYYGIMTPNNDAYLVIPYGSTAPLWVRISGENIEVIATNNNYSGYGPSYLTIQYTCTDR